MFTLITRDGLHCRTRRLWIGGLLIVVALLAGKDALAQEFTSRTPTDPFGRGHALVSTAWADATGDALPLWIRANERNRYGSASSAALLRVGLHDRALEAGPLGLAFGVEGNGRIGDPGTFYLGRIYGAVRYGALQLRLGRIEETTPTVHPTLTSGSFALSSNATALPGVSLSIPSYAPVPFTDGWLEIKGYLGHHWFEQDRLVQNVFLHSKYGYLRIGRPSPIQLYGGVVHTAMWGGRGHPEEPHIPQSWSDFLKVFFGRHGGEQAPSLDENAPLGGHLGYWDLGLTVAWSGFEITAFRQFFFDDNFSFHLQTPEDGMLGISLRRPEEKGLVTGLLWEYLHTRTQSDREDPSTLGQVSNYYNHYLYRHGYTYYGQTLGAPLLFLPKEEFDPQHDLTISHNNRVVAHHIGVEGFLSERLAYRILGTYSRNYGNYADLFEARESGEPYRFEGGLRQFHLLFEGRFQIHDRLEFHLATGLDTGELYPRTTGLRAGLHWSTPLGTW